MVAQGEGSKKLNLQGIRAPIEQLGPSRRRSWVEYFPSPKRSPTLKEPRSLEKLTVEFDQQSGNGSSFPLSLSNVVRECQCS